MPLPLPPNVGSPIAGPQGHISTQPAGGVPQGAYTMQSMEALAKGITQLFTGLQMKKQKEKKEAKDEALQGLLLLQQGIPVDQESIVKNFKKAGIQLDTEGPTPQQVAETQAKEQQAMNVQAAQVSPLGGVRQPDPAMTAMLKPQVQPAAPQTAPSQPGGFKKAMSGLGNMLGITSPQPGPVSPQAPVMLALEQMRQQGKLSRETEMMTMQAKKKMAGNFATALEDLVAGKMDSPAVLLAEQTGALKGPEGAAGMLRIARMTGQDNSKAASSILDKYLGGPEMRAKQLEMYFDMMQKDSDLRFRSTEQALKLVGEVEIDMGTATRLVGLLNSPDAAAKKAAQDVLHGLKTTTQSKAEQQKFDNTQKAIATGIDLAKLGIDREQLGLEKQRTAQGWGNLANAQKNTNIRLLEVQNAAMKEIAANDKDAFDRFMKVGTRPDATEEDKKTAAIGMADAAQRLGTRELTLPDGKKVGYNFTQLKAEDVSLLGGALWFDQEWRTKVAQPPSSPQVGQMESKSSLQPFIGMADTLQRQMPGMQFQEMLQRIQQGGLPAPPGQTKFDVDSPVKVVGGAPKTQEDMLDLIRVFVGR